MTRGSFRRAARLVATLLALLPATPAVADPEPSPGAALPIVRWGDLDRDEPHQLTSRVAYRRVDGAAIYAGYRYQDETRPRPQFALEAGYAVERERGLWRAELSQPLLEGRRLRLGAGFWSDTGNFEFDDEIIGSVENTLAAFWVKQDYREWYDGRGGRAFARFDLTDKYALGAEYRAERQRPLGVVTDWAVFGPDEFRANPPADPGTLRAATVTLSHDSRPRTADTAAPFIGEVNRSNRDWVRLSYERGGDALGGDFDFALVRLDARAWWKLTPSQFLSARLLAARAVDGRLPAQKQLYSGGFSTLRGHAYKADRGDRLALVNVEYAIDVWRAIQATAFVDVGRAWDSALLPNGPTMALDVGGGVQTRDQRLRLLWAHDTRRDGAPILFTVRTSATF